MLPYRFIWSAAFAVPHNMMGRVEEKWQLQNMEDKRRVAILSSYITAVRNYKSYRTLMQLSWPSCLSGSW